VTDQDPSPSAGPVEGPVGGPGRVPVTRSYRPGDWFGIFGERATVLLPPSQKARVARIWALVDDGAGFDEVLDALIADGLRELPGFVLVSESGDETKVVIRGAAHAEFVTDDDIVTVEGSSATTWAERSLAGVRAMRIDVPGEIAGDSGGDGGGGDLVIRDGLVRVARTDRPAYTADRAGSPEVVEAADQAPDVSVMDETGQQTPGDDVDRPTEDPAAASPPPIVAPAWGPPADTGPQPSVSDPGSPGHDGLTQAGNWSAGDFARPGIPGQPPAPSVLAAPVARLTFSTGEVVEVDRTVVVGRAPEARRFTSTEQPRLVTVPSQHQEISSTHLEVRPGAGADHGSAVVTDLGSTNGTVLQQPGLPPEDLQPGVAVQLIPGAIIDLGDGVTIQVGPV
jgi:hypothetical protein